MRFELPRIVDYGSIAQHTFGQVDPPGGCKGKASPGKQASPAHIDCFGEFSGS